MIPQTSAEAVSQYATGYGAPERTVAQLVGQIYEAAPAPLRCRMLEHLMQPLGALSLVAVANGVFAKLWFQSGWHALNVRPDDTRVISAGDVIKLADFVQQSSAEVIDGLTQLLSSSPIMACSAATVLLVTTRLAQRAKVRTARVSAIDPPDARTEETARQREVLHLPQRPAAVATARRQGCSPAVTDIRQP
jgi:hypothetical protein